MVDVPHDLMTAVLAVSRIAGWTSHILEEKLGEAQGKPHYTDHSLNMSGNAVAGQDACMRC